MSTHSGKPWGGRFDSPTAAVVEAFTQSVAFDQRLAAHDIRGSVAHARMLARCEVLTPAECDAIVAGLEGIAADIAAGRFAWSVAREDVHMNIEAALVERIGEVGKKLHTARSRNDQVATDLRLWLRDTLDALDGALREVLGLLVALAEREADTLMPGHTHMQPAQPVTFGHHLLAWHAMLARDRARLREVRARVNVLPLGAAALAGTSFPIDREYTARLLGFAAVAENSLDAVSDRDFAIEFCAAAALAMVHLSRMCEELVLWSSPAFGFVRLPDALCTGSSIMPQKKNPDVAELIRGKAGRVHGDLVALLTLMKGQPLAYNRDNQEDKEPLFDAADTLGASLAAFRALLAGLAVDRARMAAAARIGHPTATDLADYLVRRGVPFRDAHEQVGRAVRAAEAAGCDLAELPLDALRVHCPRVEGNVYAVLTLEGSVAARDHLGGTAPAQVRAAAARARAVLDTPGGVADP
jgi:argininosuccinate lyase